MSFLGGGGCPPHDRTTSRPRTGPPPHRYENYGQCAGGAHPTGMHSCLYSMNFDYFIPKSFNRMLALPNFSKKLHQIEKKLDRKGGGGGSSGVLQPFRSATEKHT